jgi:hypothetical protein
MMKNRKIIKLGLRRLLISFLIAFGLILVGSEAAFYLLKEDTDRAPEEIELVIPAGTAEKVANGEAIPSIPEEVEFVLGDTLVVNNHDIVDHQLGPLWIPPQSKASLFLDTADRYAYSCSFQPSRYLGIDVKQATTLETRLTALLFSVPATTAFIFIYSLVHWPLVPKPADSKGKEQVQERELLES